MDYAYTYWEGTLPLINKLCIGSITKIFGQRHIHTTPDNIDKYIKVPTNIKNTLHVGFRADYIRAALLKKYGGWWFDCDIFLLRNPEILVNLAPKIWQENKPDIHGKKRICCGVLYSHADSEWLVRIESELKKININNNDVWTIGQSVYINFFESVKNLALGPFTDFYPIIAEDWNTLWNGAFEISPDTYGIQFYTSKLRRKLQDEHGHAKIILNLESVKELISLFPDSFLANHFKEPAIINRQNIWPNEVLAVQKIAI